ncbi:efflux RND transporter permease subunit [Denitromonas iodatirespirans]|uniref:Efflux RND transporter permease subunit n=1 Tax=Denitromonas iodatirespirans TaxID=2795389 RepID=A0A944HA43_DENI1|nr:efflux RND transporter permease subunit [Denitromonas iodatirespirans]MBT0964148.1 efflux RND transporter permease subunit [Denitromonas iodatirespirans]
MNVSSWSIRRPIPAILLFFILSLMGLLSFNRLEIQEFPDIELPAVGVVVALPGATASQLETEVTRKVEGAISNITGVEHVVSTVTEGVSQTVVSFRLEKNMQEAVDEVRNAVTGVRSSLPASVEDPRIAKISISGAPILTFMVESASMDELDLSWFVDDAVSKRLMNVAGVGSIIRQGGVEREVLVELDPTRLQSLGVTPADISEQVFAAQYEISGGRGRVGGAEQSLRSTSAVNSASALASLSIPLADGRTIRLGEVATIHDGGAERNHVALKDGVPVVSFQVYRSKYASEVTVAEDVRAALTALGEAHPAVEIIEIDNELQSTVDEYDAAMSALYEGGVLTLIVVWLFLRDRRATLVSAFALPLSVLPTFLFMDLLGFTLNIVTLLAMTLVIGLLVDDAIVEVENIVRHQRKGKPPFQAALEAADEIGLAVVATTLTLVAVFLPTAFMGGVSGRVFQQFGWTASIAVLASLVVARMITPMMSAYLLKEMPAQEIEQPGKWMERYLATVRWGLARPVKTSFLAALVFIFSIVVVADLSVDFIPAGDSGKVTVTMTTPPGATIEKTVMAAEAARTRIARHPDVESVFTSIGSGKSIGGDATGSSGDTTSAQLVLTLRGDRDRSQREVEADIRETLQHIPGIRFAIGSGETGEKYSLVLAGDNPEALRAAALSVANDMRRLSGFGTVGTSANLLQPEIVVRPDLVRTSDLGVSTLAIGQTLRIATSGDYDTSLPKLNLQSRQLAIRVQLDQDFRSDLTTLSNLRVRSSSGTVPLAAVANISVESGPSQIDRLDRERHVTVDMELNGRPLSDAIDVVETLPSVRNLPPGVHRVAAGDWEAQQKLFGNFAIAMLTGILCVYAVLVLLFNDFMQPLTILAALPLSAVGAFFGLWICDMSLSMPSLIGVIMLMGLVTKNSILLVDYAIIARRDEGMARTEAILDACRKRARPIVMTTVAMIAGMLPMALGVHGDPSFRSPMGVVVIGGLMTSTVLSLFVVPVVYEIVDNIEQRIGRIFRRRKDGPPAQPASAECRP